MDSAGTFLGAAELNHKPSFSIDTTARLIAVPSLVGGQALGTEPYRVISEDPELEFMTRFGLPLAAPWEIRLGSARSLSSTDWIENGEGSPLVRFLDWPLSDGKRWDIQFMRRDLQVTATESASGYRMEVALEGRRVMTYEYDHDAQWFRSITVFGEGDDVALHAELLGHGGDYAGRVQAHDLHVGAIAGCHGGMGSLPASPGLCPAFGVDAHPGGEASFRTHFTYVSTGPGATTAVRDGPEGPVVWHTDACPCNETLDVTDRPLEPGRYAWLLNDFMSGDRWMYFMSFSRCFNEYEIRGESVAQITQCERFEP